MKMEILLEPTSNKLMVEHAEYDESNTYVLERFNTSAGNPVKKILLKLNLSDHRLCKMVVECQSVKVKEFQERCNIKAFQEWYEHVGPEVASPQDGKVTRWRRDCAWLMISRCSRSQCQIQVQGTSSIQEVNDHYNIFTRESQELLVFYKLGAHVREFESMVRRDTDEIYTMLDDEQKVMSLRTTVHAQMSEIRELQSADRSRQRAISDLLETDRGRREDMRELRAADRARQQQIIQTLTVMQTHELSAYRNTFL
ncbi:hypothetical protein Tco_0481162 [Tanacetum coccineum]